ncbi:spindle and kinetochore-associated protein 1 [Rousettus aegyptiacus]|uniref:SKA complex subunit 1 n=1 Tax=Rousettus aegyptiacus TaxID=9407 RepID=A0A7J8DKY6_ROUAE|nr:spindle and kinetochore-associated protein 1 [Rousettus aegyptiacus]XP_036085939.1 spindle and kinetochore-associated protein 1 [Rousettus aegyptiacus]KAF6423763.1 spindle and kinetochore associated complex subunit 1 [Rousettus aegyptiacus]
MASSDLEQICSHINEKIGNIKKTLSLRNCGQEPALKTILNKIGDEIIVVNELLNKLELEIQYQEQTNHSLKELYESLEEDYKDVEHLKENIPPHLPQVTVTQNSANVSDLDSEEPVKVEEPVCTKKPTKEQRNIKEMPFITSDEFNGIPAYMKLRLTYCQINDVIKEINKAVLSKYKILHQPKKSAMSSVARNLYHRFIDEETKDTKGHYFIVEADIKEFTALKVDKRFHVILNILRHCRRLSEVRGGGLTRYVIT